MRVQNTAQQVRRRKVTLERIAAAGGKLVEAREDGWHIYGFADGTQLAVRRKEGRNER